MVGLQKGAATAVQDSVIWFTLDSRLQGLCYVFAMLGFEVTIKCTVSSDGEARKCKLGNRISVVDIWL